MPLIIWGYEIQNLLLPLHEKLISIIYSILHIFFYLLQLCDYLIKSLAIKAVITTELHSGNTCCLKLKHFTTKMPLLCGREEGEGKCPSSEEKKMSIMF